MINLLPPIHKENIEYGRKNTQVLSWLIAVTFGIVILILTAMVGKLTIRASVAQVSSQKSDLENKQRDSGSAAIEKQYGEFTSNLTNVKKIYQQQILYSRLIRKLGTLLPPGTKLTTVSLTDKDRAINLNFSNEQPGLGPTIQINLENQGDQIAGITRKLFTTAFSTPIGGAASEQNKDEAAININQSTRELSFDVNIPDTKEGNDKLKIIQNSLKNGGEFAYETTKISLGDKISSKEDLPKSAPKFRSYSVDTTNKRVDMYFNANSIAELQDIRSDIDKSAFQPFIETYLFEDRDFLTNKNCAVVYQGQVSKKDGQSCQLKCSDSSAECTPEKLICTPLKEKGCQYVIRGYYDELYRRASIELIAQNVRKNCKFACSHKVTALYSELFEKVDINRVGSCSKELTTGLSVCPVEIRAEFGVNSKFYLANPEVEKK
jgi:hypothetical protein